MGKHNIAGTENISGGSMYLSEGELAGHILDARDGTDTRMQEIIQAYEMSGGAVLRLVMEA